jgi:hypothetical protein
MLTRALLVPILSQMNPYHTTPFNLLRSSLTYNRDAYWPPHHNFVWIHLVPMRATCTAHLILLDNIIVAWYLLSLFERMFVVCVQWKFVVLNGRILRSCGMWLHVNWFMGTDVSEELHISMLETRPSWCIVNFYIIYSNILTSESPVANPKSGPDYSVFITK